MRRSRYRRLKPLSTASILAILFLIIGALTFIAISNSPPQFSSIDLLLLGVFCALLLLIVVWGIRYVSRLARLKKYKNTTLSEVDAMSGVEFEDFVYALYEKQGFSVSKTPMSGDLGVDLVASKEGMKIAVQVKRYQGDVGRSAVSDAVAGMAHYKCSKCVVVTNSYFTKLARTLAYANNCQLIDRTALGEMILSLKEKPLFISDSLNRS